MCLFSSNFAWDRRAAPTPSNAEWFRQPSAASFPVGSPPPAGGAARGSRGESVTSPLKQSAAQAGRDGAGSAAATERARPDGGGPGQGRAGPGVAVCRHSRPSVGPSVRGRRGRPAPNEVGGCPWAAPPRRMGAAESADNKCAARCLPPTPAFGRPPPSAPEGEPPLPPGARLPARPRWSGDGGRGGRRPPGRATCAPAAPRSGTRGARRRPEPAGPDFVCGPAGSGRQAPRRSPPRPAGPRGAERRRADARGNFLPRRRGVRGECHPQPLRSQRAAKAKQFPGNRCGDGAGGGGEGGTETKEWRAAK